MTVDPCSPLAHGLLPYRSSLGRRWVGCVCGALVSANILSGCSSDEYARSPKTSAENLYATGGTSGLEAGTPHGASAGGSAHGGTAPTTANVAAMGGNLPAGTNVAAGSSSTTSSGSLPTGLIRATAGSVATSGRATGGSGGVSTEFTLRKAADMTDLWFGVALASYLFKDASYSAVAASEFNYLTPENEMKWSATEPNQNVFSFGGGDALVAFAQAHQMRVKGHTLVWHAQLPAWVQTLSTTEEVRLAMTRHIQTVAGHFKGKIAGWDVVNEAIDDGNGNALRDSIFRQKLGDTYIDEAFRVAHGADPDALLLYNDYGIEGLNGKSNAAYALVKRLRESGAPIDGVGLQMHIRGTGSPTVADIAANMRRIGELGLLVNISEMDVNLCDVPGDQAQKFAVEQQRYREVIAACVAEPMCHAVTLWGVSDKYSWLNSFAPCVQFGQTGNPWGLPWDDSFVRKPAWDGILDALLGK